MTQQPKGLLQTLQRWAAGFRSSTLAMVVGSLFILDVLIPDFLPFVDEIILGVVTILIARWQSRRAEPQAASKPPPKNVTPQAD